MKDYNFTTYNELLTYINTLNNDTFLNYLDKSEYTHISTQEFHKLVLSISVELKNLGIQANHTVGIYIDSSPFWLIYDFAIHQLGAVSVPIFSNISSTNLHFEIQDSNIKFLIIDSKEQARLLKDEELMLITVGFEIERPNSITFDDILFRHKSVENLDSFVAHIPKEDDIFSIIYTSGNTGTPKGVMLSHKNIITQLKDINCIVELKSSQDRILSVLPLAHIFERTVMSFYLSKGVSIYFIDEIPNLANLLKVVKPTIMTAVPRLIEKIYYKIIFNISQKPIISKVIAKNAFAYASSNHINKDSLIYKIFDKLVYSKLRDIFGGELEKLVSGGAPLNKEICQFFENINVNVFQGYGLSEFSPVVCTNFPGSNKIGSCGKVLNHVKVKISKDDELLVQGDSMMIGYLNQEKLTKSTIIDGWLHTGDYASIDKEGYLYIKSRMKEIYKTSNGEFISAVQIEQLVSKNKYIEFCVAIAQNRNYVSALLFVDHEKFELLNKKNLDIDDFFNQKSVAKSIRLEIAEINNSLNSYEQIQKYTIMTNKISIEGGELTPSMKVCRAKIEDKYKDTIDLMYKSNDSTNL